MHYIKIPIVFAIAYCIITSYNILYAMENNSGILTIVDTCKHDHKIVTNVNISFEYNSDQEKKDLIRSLSDSSFKSTNKKVAEYIEKVKFEHTFQYNHTLNLPLLDFIHKKIKQNGQVSFSDHLIFMGVSLSEDMPSPIKKLICNMNNFDDVVDLEKQVDMAKKEKWYSCGVRRNNLHNAIENMLDKWGIHNPEKPSTWQAK